MGGKSNSRPAVTPLDPYITARLPENQNAEHAVLGALLRYPEIFPVFRCQIDPSDFHDVSRRLVFCKMLQLGASNCSLVAGALVETDRPELAAYASAVMDEACTPGQMPLYLNVLKLKSVERQRIQIAELVSIRGRDGDTDGMLAAIQELTEIRDYQPPGDEVQFMSAKQLLQRSVTPREFLLDPVLTTSAMAEIFSWRGVGKTFFALSLAGAISSGGTFLRWRAPKARKVLFVDGELDEHSLQQRVRLLGIGNDNLDLLCCDAQETPFPHLAEPRAQRIIEDRLKQTGSEVQILDNLSALAPSTNETEAEEWNILQTWFKELKRRYGVTTVFLHHAGHSGTSRGTTRREDLLDVVIELRKPKDYKASEGLRMELVFAKTRGKLSQYAEPLECSLGEANGQLLWNFKELEDVRATEVSNMRAKGMSEREIATETGIPRSTVQRLLQKAQARK